MLVQLAMQQAFITAEYAHLVVATVVAGVTVRAQTTMPILEVLSQHVAPMATTTPAVALVVVLQGGPAYQAQHPTPINVLAPPARCLH